MFLFILFLISSVALNAAQINTGPQTFTKQQFSFPSENNDKELVQRQYTFYIAPLQLNAQNENNIRSGETSNQENQEIEKKDTGTQQRSYSRFINFSPIEESEGQNREQAPENAFNQREQPVYLQLQEALKLINSEEKPQEQDQIISFRQGSQLEKEFLKSIPKTLFSNKNQEQKSIGEEIQQKWNRILNNNRVNLKSLSLSNDQFLRVQPERQGYAEINNNEEQRNTESGDVIKYILRSHGSNEFDNQNVFGREESNSQNKPFFIQEQRTANSDDNNKEKGKALSDISDKNQFLDIAQYERSKDESQNDSDVRQQIEDIIKNRFIIGFGKQNDFGVKRFNYKTSPMFNPQQLYRVYGVLDNNRDELKTQSNNREKEQENIKKLVKDIVRNRNNNNFGKQNGARSEKSNYQGLSFFNENQREQQQPLNNNKVHLKALSTISEDNTFWKDYFGNRS